MSKRAWIHEALNLRFNKKIKINQISKQLNIPRTTLQSLLRRFARSGLSWPIPDDCSPEQLGQLLYPGTFRQQNLPECVAQVATPGAPAARRRPNFPPEFKRHLVELSMQPGANVARIAREHGINDNLLFNWRHRYRQELICQHEEPELLPVSVSAAPGPDIHPTITESSCDNSSLSCEVAMPGGTLRLQGAVTPALLCVLLNELKGGHQ
ncbi:transposase [Salmonella enterica subsp. enterica serovar Enteritidis]|nr:transposase [Salmonella enterica subsp. enterica serovar Enteritidis]EGW9206030.1 transposase [Salmonella enterica subsp. enterica serovar Enteritidis]EIW3594176.1 transposase [Salmonella enterica]